MKRIYISTKSYEDWKRTMKDGNKQFQDGYSAKTLAECWEDAKGFPKSVNDVFNNSNIEVFKEIELLFAFPEYKVQLKGKGGQSVNDIFILAKNKTDYFSIMVEGKVDEPFGTTVEQWLKDESENKKLRLNSLYDLLDLDRHKVNENIIRYQLLHRTASAILEAKRINAKHAVMLVHSFSSKNKWFEDYQEFLELFNVKRDEIKTDKLHFAKEIGGINLYFGWVKGEKKYLKEKRNKKVVGVDGCRAGWISVCLEDDKWEVNLFSNIEDLWHHYSNSSCILIDIPIGLKENDCKERLCDLEARKILTSKRASSVFTVPSRSAVYAESYDEANEINKIKVNRGIPIQSWGIVSKIKEVDTFLRGNTDARSIIKESHPEVCFCALASKPMDYSKKDTDGFKERLEVLKSYNSKTEEIVDYTLNHFLRKEVQKDDIIDALCMAIIGVLGKDNGLISIPQNPEIDAKGLEMHMLYSKR